MHNMIVVVVVKMGQQYFLGYVFFHPLPKKLLKLVLFFRRDNGDNDVH